MRKGTILTAFILFVSSLMGSESPQELLKSFYLLNHTGQTLEFVKGQKEKYLPLRHFKMGIWDAVKLVDTLVDESRPDQIFSPSHYFCRTAEALRKDNQPRWLILTGFIYDLGKVLTLYGEPSWAVYGETFPVGCAFSDLIAFAPYFRFNPDKHISRTQMLTGVYAPYCGLAQIHMSWGQDEYLYHVVKDYLPEEAAFIIRFRSFKSLQKGGYRHLLSAKDLEMLPSLTLFKQYEQKGKELELDWLAVKPYYEALVAEFFPPVIDW